MSPSVPLLSDLILCRNLVFTYFDAEQQERTPLGVYRRATPRRCPEPLRRRDHRPHVPARRTHHERLRDAPRVDPESIRLVSGAAGAATG